MTSTARHCTAYISQLHCISPANHLLTYLLTYTYRLAASSTGRFIASANINSTLNSFVQHWQPAWIYTNIGLHTLTELRPRVLCVCLWQLIYSPCICKCQLKLYSNDQQQILHTLLLSLLYLTFNVLFFFYLYVHDAFCHRVFKRIWMNEWMTFTYLRPMTHSPQTGSINQR